MRRRGLFITIACVLAVLLPVVSVAAKVINAVALPGKVKNAAEGVQKLMDAAGQTPSMIAILLFVLVMVSLWMSDERRAQIMERLYGTKGVRLLDTLEQGADGGRYRFVLQCVSVSPTDVWVALDSVEPQKQVIPRPHYLPLSGEVRGHAVTLKPDEMCSVELVRLVEEWSRPLGLMDDEEPRLLNSRLEIHNSDRVLTARMPVSDYRMTVTVYATGMAPMTAVFELVSADTDKPYLKNVTPKETVAAVA